MIPFLSSRYLNLFYRYLIYYDPVKFESLINSLHNTEFMSEVLNRFKLTMNSYFDITVNRRKSVFEIHSI